MTEDVEMPDAISTTENDLAQKDDEVTDETFFVQSSAVIVYVDVAQNDLTPLVQNRPPQGQLMTVLLAIVKLMFWMWLLLQLPLVAGTAPMETCLDEPYGVKTQGPKDWESTLWWLAILALVATIFLAWRLKVANRRLLQEIYDLNLQLETSNVRANAMVIMYDEQRSTLNSRTMAYERARQAFVDQRAAATEMQQALLLATNDLGPGYQAQMDLRQHVRRCPLNDEVYIQDGSSCWHRDEECEELYESGREIRTYQFCPICARQDLVVPGNDAMEFFTEHGVRVVDAPEGMFD